MKTYLIISQQVAQRSQINAGLPLREKEAALWRTPSARIFNNMLKSILGVVDGEPTSRIAQLYYKKGFSITMCVAHVCTHIARQFLSSAQRKAKNPCGASRPVQ